MSPTYTGSSYTTTGKTRQQTLQTEAMASAERDRATLYRGICSNCENLETCSYPSPISETWFCEEYSVAPAKKELRVLPDQVEKPGNAKMGLCMNCEDRETCPLSKTEGGIWFCNEYR
ncbi:MAG: hypothetical protein ABSD88_19825 [Candidatus Korobacteraceae bacterium]|jgi:hypothetical protein